MSDSFVVRAGGPLRGSVRVSGATKNAGTKQMAAALLAPGVTTLRNVIGSTLGNVVGGAVLVGLVYWFVYLRPGSRPGEEAQGEEEVEEEGER